MTETRRPRPLDVTFDAGEEVFLGKCERRGVARVGVLVNTNLAMNIDSFEQLTTRIYREDHTFYKIIVSDFNAKTGTRRTLEEPHIGTHGLEWNEQGERQSVFTMTTKTTHDNSQFQKPASLRWTCVLPGGEYHNEIDHIIVNRSFCLTDVAVVPKFYTGSDHRLLRVRFFFSCKGERAAKFKMPGPKPSINWDLFTSLAGFWEDTVVDSIDEEYDRLIQHLYDSARKPRALEHCLINISHALH